MARKCTAARIAAVIAIIACNGVVADAEVHFNTNYNNTAPEQDRVACVAEFLRYNHRKFLATGSIHDRPRSGRKHKVPKDVLQQCASQLQAGYRWTPIGTVLPVTRHFTSIQQAAAMNPYLAAVCSSFNVKPQQLLKMMKKVDKGLMHKTLHFKRPLTPQQQQARRSVAIQLYTRQLQDPTLLRRTCWVDECSISFSSSVMAKGIKVWCHRSDSATSATFFNHSMQPGTKYRTTTVRLMAMANCLLGPTSAEFTTGTTDLQRRLLDPVVFLVSATSCALHTSC